MGAWKPDFSLQATASALRQESRGTELRAPTLHHPLLLGRIIPNVPMEQHSPIKQGEVHPIPIPAQH